MSGDAAVVRPEQFTARWRTASAELDGAVGKLATSDGRLNPLFSTQVVGSTFRAGNELQEQAWCGSPVEPDQAGGLAMTTDGLAWTG